MSSVRPLLWIALPLAVLGAALAWANFGLAKDQAQDRTKDIALPKLKSPVVVELFTSQSCSSCPPADRVLSEIAARENVIALGCHVTYWDHLNWKDTLSLPACTQRQRAYAAAKGSGRVYTPQMVVNGAREFVGSNRGDAQRALSQTSGALAPIGLERRGDALIAHLPALGPTLPKGPGRDGAGGPGRPYTLWLATVGPDHTQAVPSGENAGRTLRYTNPVHALTDAGPWDGQPRTLTLPLPAEARRADVQGLALLANAGRTGPIVAAGVITAKVR